MLPRPDGPMMTDDDVAALRSDERGSVDERCSGDECDECGSGDDEEPPKGGIHPEAIPADNTYDKVRLMHHVPRAGTRCTQADT